MRAVQALGLPGCSSHPNGTETGVWSGGVSISEEGSGDSINCGTENNGSLAVELALLFASNPMIVCVCVFLDSWRVFLSLSLSLQSA